MTDETGTWVNAAYLQRAVCPCGATALVKEVPLGKVYRMDLTAIQAARFVCGECSVTQTVNTILVDDGVDHGWLPLALFFLPATP